MPTSSPRSSSGHAPVPFQAVPPNGCVGILGGGQLGRMLAMAAARLGLRTHIYCPQESCPAGDVASHHTNAAYTDKTALKEFANQVDVVTYEFENVPVQTVEMLNSFDTLVSPDARALSIAQDRLNEKIFINENGGTTPRFHSVDDVDSLSKGLEITGRPAVLKTRRLGYDGKGQTRIGSPASGDDGDDLSITWDEANKRAWDAVGAQPSILEAFVPFVREISIIAARGHDGQLAFYDAAENQHSDGILHKSIVPATISVPIFENACTLTKNFMEALGYVGVIGVEFFVMEDGSLMVNEFAPRVHNSGHWTDEACAVSQFEQHIRAVCGWPLGSSKRHSDAVMENIIGAEANEWLEDVKDPNILMHLYGKVDAKAGRKMGHKTILSPLK